MISPTTEDTLSDQLNTSTVHVEEYSLSNLSIDANTGNLLFEGHNIKTLVALHSTPLFLYSSKTILSNVDEVLNAFKSFNFPRNDLKLYFATKSNRYMPILDLLRKDNRVGIDAVSPYEAELAMKAGFLPNEISVTGCFHSNRDLTTLSTYIASGLHINLDGTSQIKRLAKLVPNGTKVGLRIDTANNHAGSYSKSVYNNSKFGILASDLPEALNLCTDLGLIVNCLHMHVAYNMTFDDGKNVFEQSLETISKCADIVNSCGHFIESIDVGGGLGIKFNKNDEDRLDPITWASLIFKHLGHLDIDISCELGTKIVSNAGILVTEATTVQTKGDVTWLGIDAGFNLNCYAAHYGIYQDIVNLSKPCKPLDGNVYHIGGNMNEGIDVFGKNVELPMTEEGDLIGISNCGGYGSTMSSNHCGRGRFVEVLL
jgi:diaminopimelate decarboxylase